MPAPRANHNKKIDSPCCHPCPKDGYHGSSRSGPEFILAPNPIAHKTLCVRHSPTYACIRRAIHFRNRIPNIARAIFFAKPHRFGTTRGTPRKRLHPSFLFLPNRSWYQSSAEWTRRSRSTARCHITRQSSSADSSRGRSQGRHRHPRLHFEFLFHFLFALARGSV